MHTSGWRKVPSTARFRRWCIKLTPRKQVAQVGTRRGDSWRAHFFLYLSRPEILTPVGLQSNWCRRTQADDWQPRAPHLASQLVVHRHSGLPPSPPHRRHSNGSRSISQPHLAPPVPRAFPDSLSTSTELASRHLLSRSSGDGRRSLFPGQVSTSECTLRYKHTSLAL